MIILDSIGQVKKDYLKEFNVKKENIVCWQPNKTCKKNLLCVRIIGTEGMNTLRTYNIKNGKYIKY
ncbi:hypothetical protein ACFHWD_03585 [Clostridium sp. MT-14]|uniref:hypothetical protein n=1 Tax=Clostridium sp. MT-14 TaxID=3348360 RepID=UPI0035F28A81